VRRLRLDHRPIPAHFVVGPVLLRLTIGVGAYAALPREAASRSAVEGPGRTMPARPSTAADLAAVAGAFMGVCRDTRQSRLAPRPAGEAPPAPAAPERGAG